MLTGAMKITCAVALSLLVWAAAAAQLPSARQEPFVAAGVSYRVALARDRVRTASDLGAIRTLGFNVVRVAASWSDLEPTRGQYRLNDLDSVLELAGSAGLRVIVRLDTALPPAWLLSRYRDGGYVPAVASEKTARARACFDHPGVRADVEAFVSAVVKRVASQAAFQAVDVGSDLDAGFCLCPHTTRRFREWTAVTFGSAQRPSGLLSRDRAAFVTLERRDHLAMLGAATSARGTRLLTTTASMPSLLRAPGGAAGQDDWLMSRVVDRYGAMLGLRNGRARVSPARMAFGLDGVRGAAGAKGWLASHVTDAGAGDLRLWTWAAVSRGARGVVFGEWRGGGANEGGGLVASGEGLDAVAALARVIGRNQALFEPLRPRRARVAIVYDPRADATSVDPGRLYEALFERNIPVDVVHADEFAAGAVGGYALVVSSRESSVEGILRAATESGVAPEVAIAGTTGVVEARFLESADVLMLIGLNHADTPQRVTMTFPPDTQEAIWQNMETGAAVNFIAGADGPTYTHTFAPKDSLVLMIRKSIR
jgi:hypothetical protein